jgi:hypothetical protein
LKRFSRSSERFSLRLPGWRDVGIGDLVRAWNRKYPGKDVGFALRALGYFADVDKARMPEMLSKTTWEKVKTDLEKLVVRGVDV